MCQSHVRRQKGSRREQQNEDKEEEMVVNREQAVKWSFIAQP